MQDVSTSVAKTIAYYYPLLMRYATIVTGDHDEAEKIARTVLEDQYEINGLAPSKLLRMVLKTDVLNRCFYFKQYEIFNRPKVKALFITPQSQDNKDKSPLVN
jgi:hypothetical protein